jgi:chromate transporter
MNFNQHISFLKAVLYNSLSAFGGPQAHLSLLQSKFVEKRKELSSETLMEYNALCQMLPGATSTQTIILIGYKKGGYLLAFLTLLVWLMPACTIMTLIAILYSNAILKNTFNALIFLKPMSIAFILSATLALYAKAIYNTITRFILIATFIIVLLAFKSPWSIPLLIIFGGIVTNFSKKRIPEMQAQKIKVNTRPIIIFLILFLTAGFLSEKASKENWPHQKIFNLFETNYRFGTFVFGGGDVLVPLMYEQYVSRPLSNKVIQGKRDVIKVTSEEFLTGVGIGRVLPGPVWAITSYAGAMAVKNSSVSWQIVGAIIATLGAFLPSFFIVLFAFPIWESLKKYAVVYRSLEGINAAVVGIMLGASIYFLKDLMQSMQVNNLPSTLINLGILLGSTYLLYTKKIATHWLVLCVIGIGVISLMFQ